MRLVLAMILGLTVLSGLATPARADDAPARPLIMVHYMPWFAARTQTRPWGWHWTMNARDPEQVVNGLRQIAAHYHPLIGPYDSADPDLLEYHTLLMKVAGIDGVIADWYGVDDVHDYRFIHDATTALFDQAERAGLRFAVCYEDQSLRERVKAGKATDGPVAAARRDVDVVATTWMTRPGYLTISDRPALLVFGPQALTGHEWAQVLGRDEGDDAPRPILITLHKPVGPAGGVFDWPLPGHGGLAAVDRFYQADFDGLVSVPVAFPRFHDFYEQAGLHKSYGRIEDDGGRTFRSLLDRAVSSGAPVVQIATWNDWGEGTQIEPSVEFGSRDLEVIQNARRALDPSFPFHPEHLALPERIFRLRKSAGDDAGLNRTLDDIAAHIRAGDADAALTTSRALRPAQE